jgi:hypothetical protein
MGWRPIGCADRFKLRVEVENKLVRYGVRGSPNGRASRSNGPHFDLSANPLCCTAAKLLDLALAHLYDLVIVAMQQIGRRAGWKSKERLP